MFFQLWIGNPLIWTLSMLPNGVGPTSGGQALFLDFQDFKAQVLSNSSAIVEPLQSYCATIASLPQSPSIDCTGIGWIPRPDHSQAIVQNYFSVLSVPL